MRALLGTAAHFGGVVVLVSSLVHTADPFLVFCQTSQTLVFRFALPIRMLTFVLRRNGARRVSGALVTPQFPGHASLHALSHKSSLLFFFFLTLKPGVEWYQSL